LRYPMIAIDITPPARRRGPRPPPRLVSTTEGDTLFERRISGEATSDAGPAGAMPYPAANFAPAPPAGAQA